MSELGETFAAWRESKRDKKIGNNHHSRKLLEERGIAFQELSEHHLRIGGFDFWPSTGVFIERKTQKRGRGIFNLLKRLPRTDQRTE